MPEPLSYEAVRGLWIAHAWLRDHGSPTVRMAAPLLARYIKSLLPPSARKLRSVDPRAVDPRTR